MPIYMDRHDISDEVTAEHLARMHLLDLEAEADFDCKTMTYWCDEKRKVAFCLVHAPNEEALINMHTHAHGGYPNKIIEVDPVLVESFLGRIEDPKKEKTNDLLIIDDSAYRILMSVSIDTIANEDIVQVDLAEALSTISASIKKIISDFQGRLVKIKDSYILASFSSAAEAVACALEYQHLFTTLPFSEILKIKFGIASGVPVTESKHLFEETIALSKYLSEIPQTLINVTSEVSELFEEEKADKINTSIQVMDLNSLAFLKSFMDLMAKEWNNQDLDVESICASLGLSKSQLNRKLKSLQTLSPNQLIQEIRLQRSFSLVKQNLKNIAEIAYDSGFSSPNYFSRVFKQRFGISPKELTSHK